MCRASDAAAFSQVRSGSDHADSLYEDTGDNVRAPQEEVCRGEDRDPPEDDDDENGVLAGRVHENRLLVLGYRVIYSFFCTGVRIFFSSWGEEPAFDKEDRRYHTQFPFPYIKIIIASKAGEIKGDPDSGCLLSLPPVAEIYESPCSSITSSITIPASLLASAARFPRAVSCYTNTRSIWSRIL